jgi:hypothetical protein
MTNKPSDTQILDIIKYLNNLRGNKKSWVYLGRGDTFNRPPNTPTFVGYYVYLHKLIEAGFDALVYSTDCRGRDTHAFYFVSSESILALANPEIVNSIKPSNIEITKIIL